MTCSLIKRGENTEGHRHAWGKGHVTMKAEVGCSCKPRTPGAASKPPGSGRGRKGTPTPTFADFRGGKALPHLDWGLLASRTVRQHIPVVLKPPRLWSSVMTALGKYYIIQTTYSCWKEPGFHEAALKKKIKQLNFLTK